MKKFTVDFESGKTIEIKADVVVFQGNFVVFGKNNSSKEKHGDIIVAYNSACIKKVYNPNLHKTD